MCVCFFFFFFFFFLFFVSRDSCWITSTPEVLAGHRSQADLSYYLAFSRISATRHRLGADSGRGSISSTRSPTPQALVASCALFSLVRRSTLPYLGCLTWSSTWTTTVLSILSLTPRPSRPLR